MTLVGGRSLYSTTVSAPKGRLMGVGLNYTTTYLETKILAVKAQLQSARLSALSRGFALHNALLPMKMPIFFFSNAIEHTH